MIFCRSVRRGIRERRPSGSRNSSKRYRESCGPGADSGWYCTLNAGTSRQRMPSRVPSLRFQWLRCDASVVGQRDAVCIAHPRVRIHREPVVVARDLDDAGREVLHRLVHASVAERHLVGAPPEGQAEQLVAQTDPEDRDFAQQLADGGDAVAGRGGIARPVREEHAVVPAVGDLDRRGLGREHRRRDALRPRAAEGCCASFRSRTRRRGTPAPDPAPADRPARSPRTDRRCSPFWPGRRRPCRGRPGSARRATPAQGRPSRRRRASHRGTAAAG